MLSFLPLLLFASPGAHAAWQKSDPALEGETQVQAAASDSLFANQLPIPPLDTAGYLNLPSEPYPRGYNQWAGEFCFQQPLDEVRPKPLEEAWPWASPSDPKQANLNKNLTKKNQKPASEHSLHLHTGGSRANSDPLTIDSDSGPLTIAAVNILGGGEGKGPWEAEPDFCQNYWTYSGNGGPEYWHLNFPACDGSLQSPIYLDPNEATKGVVSGGLTNSPVTKETESADYETLEFNFGKSKPIIIENTGNTIMIKYGNVGGVKVPIKDAGGALMLPKGWNGMWSGEEGFPTEAITATIEIPVMMSNNKLQMATKKSKSLAMGVPVISKNGIEAFIPKITSNSARDLTFVEDTIKRQFDISTLSVSVEGNSITATSLNGTIETYFLNNIHFHTGTEHKIVNRDYEFEMHMVFTSAGGEIYEVGVFIDAPSRKTPPHPFFPTDFKGYFPEGLKQRFDFADIYSVDYPNTPYFDLGKFPPLPVGDCGSYICADRFVYEGSIGVPPCFEGVKWSVYEKPLHISQLQMRNLRRFFRQNLPENNKRPLNPRNDREIKFAVYPPASSEPDWGPLTEDVDES